MIETPDWPSKNFSFLGNGCRLVGTFHLTGMVRLSSRMEGELFIDPANGSLVIERQGHFQGTVHCGDIEIFGELRGHIISSGRVVLQPSSQIEGKIETQNLCIYPGATVNIEGHTGQETL